MQQETGFGDDDDWGDISYDDPAEEKIKVEIILI